MREQAVRFVGPFGPEAHLVNETKGSSNFLGRVDEGGFKDSRVDIFARLIRLFSITRFTIARSVVDTNFMF